MFFQNYFANWSALYQLISLGWSLYIRYNPATRIQYYKYIFFLIYFSSYWRSRYRYVLKYCDSNVMFHWIIDRKISFDTFFQLVLILDCLDKQPENNCMGWKRSGYCAEGHRYHQYMKFNCKKTCGFCGNVSSPRIFY